MEKREEKGGKRMKKGGKNYFQMYQLDRKINEIVGREINYFENY